MVREMIGGCCVCLDERGWNENPLVYCDGSGCTVAVHQACYGIVKVPSGPWFCCKCRSQERVARVKCELCPNKEGALKRTDSGGWAHVVCALYIPEVRFGDVGTMEPIIFSSIPHDRFMKTCFICEENGRESRSVNGACMNCHKSGCKLSFHVTCAQSRRQLCEEASVNGHVQYVGYCTQHWTRRYSKQVSNNVPTSSNSEISDDKNVGGNKRGRARNDSTSSTNSVEVQQKTRGRRPKKIDSSPDTKTKEKAEETSPVKGNNEITGKKKDEESGKSKGTSSHTKQTDHNANSYGNISNEKIKGSSPLNTPVPIFHKNDKTDEESSGSSVVNNSESIGKRAEARKRKLENDKEKEKEKLKKKQKVKIETESNDKDKKKKMKIVESKKKDKSMTKEKEKNSEKKIKIPQPSKLGLVENGKVSSWDSVMPKHEETPDNFQDFLEHQWNESAQFIMSKAEHFDVASLLTCLHQLKADNLKLEKKLMHIQARRDRLLGVNARLAKSFTDSPPENGDSRSPLSAMLSKLNDKPVSESPASSSDFEIKESPETKELRKKRPVASPDLAMLAAASLKFESQREGREERDTINDRTDNEIPPDERPPNINNELSINSLLIQPTVNHHKSNSLINSSFDRLLNGKKDSLAHANFFGDSVGQSSSSGKS